jgi:hypothetical protein
MNPIFKEPAVDAIIPVPPFEPYNPFERYYSSSEIRQGDKSLYLEFLGVDADNPEEVVNFCERFGVLGDAEKAGEWLEDKGLQRIRTEYDLETFADLAKNDRLKKDLIGKPATDRFPPEQLCLTQSIGEFKSCQLALRNALTPDPAIFPAWSPTQLKDITRSFTNNFLMDSHVQPQLNWNVQEDRWELIWVSYDLFGYLCIMLMLDLLGRGKFLSCPRCDKIFLTASNRVKFCSPSCYENYKVQKYQKKKKEELLAVQKGKKMKTRKSTGKKK